MCGLAKQNEKSSFPLTLRDHCWEVGPRMVVGIPGASVLELAGLVEVGSEEWGWTKWKWRNVYISVPESPYLTFAESRSKTRGLFSEKSACTGKGVLS